MTPAAVALGLWLLLGRVAGASPHGGAPPAPKVPSAPPAAKLPMLPSVSRVRVEAMRDHVLLVMDIDLPKGNWKSGSLDLYAAFGAPGTPLAVDARLVGRAQDNGVAGGGERVAVRVSVRRGPGTLLLLGQPRMAGVALHLGGDQLRRVYSGDDHAVLRIRSLLAAPATDSTGARSLVVRLGIAGGIPLPLGRIQVASREPGERVAGAEATLCGPEADPSPLSVGWRHPAPGPKEPAPAAALAPSAAVRHATDDLCIRWWTAPSAPSTGAAPAVLDGARRPNDFPVPTTSAAPPGETRTRKRRGRRLPGPRARETA